MKVAAVLLILILSLFPTYAQDRAFFEKFSQPELRREALKLLSPQSSEWFQYHALLALHEKKFSEYDAWVGRWQLAAAEQNSITTEGLESLENRAMLLRNGNDVAATAALLTRQMKVTFDHQAPSRVAAQQHPDAVRSTEISDVAFLAEAKKSADAPWEKMSHHRLLDDLAGHKKSPADVQAKVLARVSPHDPGAIELLTEWLKAKESRFANYPATGQLTRPQCETLLRSHPRLIESAEFVTQYLRTLAPSAEGGHAQDLMKHLAYWQQCDSFLQKTPRTFGRYKEVALRHLLLTQQQLGQEDQDDLLRYLELPTAPATFSRAAGLFRSDGQHELYNEPEAHAAMHGAQQMADTQWLEALLMHHLKSYKDAATKGKNFAGLIPEKILENRLAHAKLLNGGAEATWGKLLTTEEIAELRERTEIRFAPNQVTRFTAAQEKVTLLLDCKNTPQMEIRIYALDLAKHYLDHAENPDAAIAIDGIAPQRQITREFSQDSMLRHREEIVIDQLSGPGAWLIECVSRGVSSRMLLRKGMLHPFIEVTDGGASIRAFDESGDAVLDFSVRHGLAEIKSDAQGVVVLPFRETDDLPNHAVLAMPEPNSSASRMATRIADLPTLAAPWQLRCGFHLDEEQLLSEKKATLFYHAQLFRHRVVQNSSVLRNASVALTFSHHDGSVTKKSLALKDISRPGTLEFDVPNLATSLKADLHAEIPASDSADATPLSSATSWDFQQSLGGEILHHPFYTHTPAGHILELRGRNGELMPHRVLDLVFFHENFDPSVTINLTLQTNEMGRIMLGELAGITMVQCKMNGKTNDYRPREKQETRYPTSITAATNREIRVALAVADAAIAPERMHLLKKNLTGAFQRTFSDRLQRDGRTLILRNLPPGDFTLLLPNQPIEVHILDAHPAEAILRGKESISRSYQPSATHISDCRIVGEDLVITVANAESASTVDIAATSFAPRWDLNQPANALPIQLPGSAIKADIPSSLLMDRQIDEETRYVMDRRHAKIFPGNMLQRPGRLLRRLADAEETAHQALPAPMEEGMKRKSGMGGLSLGSGFDLAKVSAAESSPSCDFLAETSRMFYQLPVKNGTVRINAQKLKGFRNLQIIAWSGLHYDQRSMPLSNDPPATRPRQLIRALDAEKQYAGTRRSMILRKNDEATINNMIDAKWQAYRTIDDVFQSFLARNPALAPFQALTKWPMFQNEEKIRLWNQLGCHEVDLFLSIKDPEFFRKYVKPSLEQKTDRGFMDEYILGRDLSVWLNIARWNRLNAAEQALLCRAMPAAALKREIQHQTDLYYHSAGEEERFAQLLDSATLEETDRLGIAASTLREMLQVAESSSIGRDMVEAKLRSIIIPSVQLEDATLEEAVDFIKMRVFELDTAETDPARRGVNFQIRRPRGRSSAQNDGLGPDDLRIREIRLTNVPVTEALQQICDQTRLKFSISDQGVMIVPASDNSDDIVIVHRVFQVTNATFASMMSKFEGGDPFGEPSAAAQTAKQLLEKFGVPFPSQTNAIYSPKNSTLIVINTPTNIALVEELLQPRGIVSGVAAFPATPATPTDFMQSADPFGSSRGMQQPPMLDAPRVYIEHRYWKQRTTTEMQSEIMHNRFWNDVAAWDGKSPFLSPHFGECDTANAALLCLALLDLPYVSTTPETRIQDDSLHIKAKQDLLLFFRDTRATEKIDPTEPLQVRQSFYPLNQRFRTDGGVKTENRINDGKFLTSTAYGTTITITNLSSMAREALILTQIPRGAVALSGGLPTHTKIVPIDPGQSMELSYAFYFPQEIQTLSLPPQIANTEETIIGKGITTAMNVKIRHDLKDQTFAEIADSGQPDAVLKELESINLHADEDQLNPLLWRLKDKAFYQKTSAILQRRMYFHPQVFSYALLHQDPAGIRAWLENQFIPVGPWLDSPWQTFRPQNDTEWLHREFDPFVNPRAHQLGEYDTLPLEQAAIQYSAFLNLLCYKSTPDDDDRFIRCMYLLMQNRIEEALTHFAKIDPTKHSSRMAYDYLKSYLLFYQEKPAAAKSIAIAYRDHPLDLWRQRFGKVIQQAEEIERATAPASNVTNTAIAAASSLKLEEHSSGKLRIKHQQLTEAKISLYQVDMELMFSAAPFLDEKPTQLQALRPNQMIRAALKDSETVVDLPAAFRKGNVIAVAESGTLRSILMLGSPALDCRRISAPGEVVICASADRAPLSRSYVKVYAMNASGEAVFHKDGYTDLRGRFDFRSHSSQNPSTMKRFALLIHHPAHGSRIEQYEMP